MAATPIQKIHVLPFGAPGASQRFLVQLTTEGGATGLGEIGAEVTQAPDEALEFLAPALLGRLPTDREALWYALIGSAGDWEGDRQLMAATVAAVDAAVWDLAGKELGLSCGVLMGGRTRSRCELALRCGRADDRDAVRVAERLAKQGVRTFLFEVEARQSSPTAPLRTVRRALGDGVLIGVHLVTPCASAEEAVQVGLALDRVNPYWIGNLLPDGQWSELAQVRAAIASPTAAGRTPLGLQPLMRALQAGCADAITPGLDTCGGPTGALKLAELVEAHGARFSLAAGDSPVSLLAATHVSLARIAAGPVIVSPQGLEALQTQQPDLIRDGFLLPPTLPGVGLPGV